MTAQQAGQAQPPAPAERRLTPRDLHDVRFDRAGMLKGGYDDAQVDRFLLRVADELARSMQEKAELRDQVRALQQQVAGSAAEVAPSEQALRIIAVAQQTADQYVAEAEDFSQQMSRDARVQYEEQMRQARDSAGAIIAAAQEAAARMTGGTPLETSGSLRPSVEELEEQVAYLKAFGQAVRTQLRSYLEALLTDVEGEWGRAHPGALPSGPYRTPAGRAEDRSAVPSRQRNVAAELPADSSRNGGSDDADSMDVSGVGG